jgi:hypothetical protein
LLKQGLDTAAPQLQLASGQTLTGQYEESLGSLMLFEQPPRPAPGAAGPSPPQQPPQQQTAARLLCHTEQRLRFKKEPPP